MNEIKNAKQKNADYVKSKADEIKALVSISGTDFSYNILSASETDEDLKFRKHYSEILNLLKDYGFKIWGTGNECVGVAKWHVTKQ